MIDDRIELLATRLAEDLANGAYEGLPRVQDLTPKVSVARLFTASEEGSSQGGGYDYSHHASLGVADGLLHAFWSNGNDGEDLPGQVQRWAYRDAQGNWSQPQLLAAPPMNPATYPQATTAINGGTATGTPQLVSFYSEYKGRPADGAGGEGKWSEPVITGVQVLDAKAGWAHRGPLAVDYLLNEGPRRAASGRWLMTGEDHLGRTRVAVCDAPDPAAGPWRLVPVPKGEGGRHKNEPTWFQRRDGSLGLLLRDDGGSRALWLAESFDGGDSWLAPRITNFPDATSKCHAGWLADGPRYIISNPNPNQERIPLTIALSDDGVVFDRMAVLRDEPTAPRLSGRFKGPGYQYPNAIEHGGSLHVIYSVNKEDVEVLSVPRSVLEGLQPM